MAWSVKVQYTDRREELVDKVFETYDEAYDHVDRVFWTDRNIGNVRVITIERTE